eukprot:gene6541-7215_t
MEEPRQVYPGDCLGSAKEFSSGNGTYLKDGQIYSSLVGRLMTSHSHSHSHSQSHSGSSQSGSSSAVRPLLHIVPDHPHQSQQQSHSHVKASDYILRIGDTVLCQVTRVNYNQAFVEVIMVGDLLLSFPVKAVIRKEDIREKEVDKVIIPDLLKPRDTVRAMVISLGDNKHYYLSIARAGLGIILPMKTDETTLP